MMSAMQISRIPPPPPSQTAARIFRGELLAFGGLGGIRKLGRAARGLLRECFECADPPRAHLRFGKEEFIARAQAAREAFDGDSRFLDYFAAAMGEAGFAAADLFWDRLILRVAPPPATHGGGLHSHTHPHRDTWGVAIFSQMNWWTPLWPLSHKRALGFWPDYFNRPLANTTARWSFGEYSAARKVALPGQKPDYPAAPTPTESPQGEPLAALVAPGELLCFSAAHLHGTIARAANLTRFNIEIRTVYLPDIRANRAAPNADCATPKMAAGLFSRVADRGKERKESLAGFL
jgi:hypothetical protein